MTTRRLTRRIVSHAAVLGAAVAMAVAAPLSASAAPAPEVQTLQCDYVDDSNLPDSIDALGCDSDEQQYAFVDGEVFIFTSSSEPVYTCQSRFHHGRIVTAHSCDKTEPTPPAEEAPADETAPADEAQPVDEADETQPIDEAQSGDDE
ncbi:hypothetical protein [Actinophytocola oryzae]|uniref:Chitin binding peritrophin-A-like protein n=1 Tax=Actinophytocola oryzae TaxID=502181 RepID=A0A4R7VEX2_9PSEU|nr:hypothetical protein [Actinophytocola oryzae]TDV47766.1 hypothetical protein CLV71_1091 [Actinophytocola oryzae]